MPVKPETEIKNLKRELKDLRQLVLEIGVPYLIAYMPSIMFHKKKKFKKQPRLNKKQKEWIEEKKKEFDKMRKS